MAASDLHAVGAASPIDFESGVTEPGADGRGVDVFGGTHSGITCRGDPARRSVGGFIVRLGRIGQHPRRVEARGRGEARVGGEGRQHRWVFIVLKSGKFALHQRQIHVEMAGVVSDLHRRIRGGGQRQALGRRLRPCSVDILDVVLFVGRGIAELVKRQAMAGSDESRQSRQCHQFKAVGEAGSRAKGGEHLRGRGGVDVPEGASDRLSISSAHCGATA